MELQNEREVIDLSLGSVADRRAEDAPYGRERPNGDARPAGPEPAGEPSGGAVTAGFLRALAAPLSGLPARARLAVAMIAVAVAGFTAVGVTGVSMFRDSLTARTDAQVLHVTQSVRWPTTSGFGYFVSPFANPNERPASGIRYPYIRSVPPGTVVQFRNLRGAVEREFTPDEGGAPPRLPAKLAAAPGTPVTVTENGHRWRVLVTLSPERDGTVVTAADLSRADADVSRLTETVVSVSGAALLIMIFIAVRAARRRTAAVSGIEAAVEAAEAAVAEAAPPRADGADGRDRDGHGYAYGPGEATGNGLVEVNVLSAANGRGEVNGRGAVAGRPETEAQRLTRAVGALIEQVEAARRSQEQVRNSVERATDTVRLPLSVIRGFVDYFRERPDRSREQLARVLDRLDDETVRIAAVLDELRAELEPETTGTAGSRAGVDLLSR